jgi:hypothetical protein
MIKKIVSILVLSAAMFAQSPKVEPKVVEEPKLTTAQQLEIVNLELQFAKATSQVQAAQQALTDLQNKYIAYTKDICKSTDGKKYVVSLDKELPVCTVAPDDKN